MLSIKDLIFDNIFEINRYLCYVDQFAFKLALGKKFQSVKLDFMKIVKEKLQPHVHNVDEFLNFMNKNNCVISGSFMLDCLYDKNWSNDIDIYEFYDEDFQEYEEWPPKILEPEKIYKIKHPMTNHISFNRSNIETPKKVILWDSTTDEDRPTYDDDTEILFIKSEWEPEYFVINSRDNMTDISGTRINDYDIYKVPGLDMQKYLYKNKYKRTKTMQGDFISWVRNFIYPSNTQELNDELLEEEEKDEEEEGEEGEEETQYYMTRAGRLYVEDHKNEMKQKEIQVIVIRYPLEEFIMYTFDIDICKNYFDGKNLKVFSWDNLFQRKCIAKGTGLLANYECEKIDYITQEINYELIKNDKDHLNRRINKYKERGFNITIDNSEDQLLFDCIAGYDTINAVKNYIKIKKSDKFDKYIEQLYNRNKLININKLIKME